MQRVRKVMSTATTRVEGSHAGDTRDKLVKPIKGCEAMTHGYGIVGPPSPDKEGRPTS